MEKNQDRHKDRVLGRWMVLNWSVKDGLMTQKNKMVTENRNLKFLEKHHYILHKLRKANSN